MQRRLKRSETSVRPLAPAPDSCIQLDNSVNSLDTLPLRLECYSMRPHSQAAMTALAAACQ